MKAFFGILFIKLIASKLLPLFANEFIARYSDLQIFGLICFHIYRSYFERIKDKNSVFSDITLRSIFFFLETTVSSDIPVVINKTIYSTAKSVYVSRGSKQHFRETTGRQLGNAERLCNNTFGLIGQKTAFRVGTRVYSTTSLNARSARRFSPSLSSPKSRGETEPV